jgi:hypothetical protein
MFPNMAKYRQHIKSQVFNQIFLTMSDSLRKRKFQELGLDSNVEPQTKRAKFNFFRTPMKIKRQEIKVRAPEFNTRYDITLEHKSRLEDFALNNLTGLLKEFLLNEFLPKNSLLSQIILLHGSIGAQLDSNESVVLVIKNGINLLMNDQDYASKMFEEQDRAPYDTVMYDHRGQRQLINRSRYKTTFGEQGQAHSEDYKQSTVIAYSQVPLLQKLRQFLPTLLGESAKELDCKATYYFGQEKSVRFQGNAQKDTVAIRCSLGRSTTLNFAQRLPKNTPARWKTIEIPFDHGDLYIVSEKVGNK